MKETLKPEFCFVTAGLCWFDRVAIKRKSLFYRFFSINQPPLQKSPLTGFRLVVVKERRNGL